MKCFVPHAHVKRRGNTNSNKGADQGKLPFSREFWPLCGWQHSLGGSCRGSSVPTVTTLLLAMGREQERGSEKEPALQTGHFPRSCYGSCSECPLICWRNRGTDWGHLTWDHLHRITAQAGIKGTHKNHWVQPMALHRHRSNPALCLRALPKFSWSSGSLGVPWGAGPNASAPSWGRAFS